MIEALLNKLEWLARYGFIDIIFGVGVTAFLWRLLRKVIPNNNDHLHVNLAPGGAMIINGARVVQSLIISIRNSGPKNCYIARAYFRPKQRRWWTLFLRRSSTRLEVDPLSDRIGSKDAFELKFSGEQPGYLSEYEAIVRPGHAKGVSTSLALVRPASQSMIDERRCGTLCLEYATSERQGIHSERV